MFVPIIGISLQFEHLMVWRKGGGGWALGGAFQEAGGGQGAVGAAPAGSLDEARINVNTQHG